MQKERVASRLARNLILLGSLIFFGVPIVWLLLAPTRTSSSLRSDLPLSFGSFENLANAFSNVMAYDNGIFGTWLANSAVYSVSTVVLSLAICVPAGYAMATFSFFGRSALLFVTLVSMIVPSAALILPLYLELTTFGLTNTPAAIILPLSFYPFGAYLVYIFARNSFPSSVVEAARIDGATEWRIFGSIFLPAARPIVVMAGFFSFAGAWSNFFLPFIMLTDKTLAPVQTGIQAMVISTNALGGANFTDFVVKEPEVALAALLSILPVLGVFLFAQRYLVAGQLSISEK